MSSISERDLEAAMSARCRICLKSDDQLISPCKCEGAQQFVHRACLDNLRAVKEAFAFSHCTTCKAQFHLRKVEFEDKTWRNIKLKLRVARDAFLAFLVLQIVSIMFGYILYTLQVKEGPQNI